MKNKEYSECILPPIDFFYGRNAVKAWISKCKPFVPTERGRYVELPECRWISVEAEQRLELYMEERRQMFVKLLIGYEEM